MDTTNIKRREGSSDISGDGEKKVKNKITQSKTEPQAQPQKIVQRPAQLIPPPQPKNTTNQPTEIPLSPILPSISPISNPKLFSQSYSLARYTIPPASSTVTTKHRVRSASNEFRRAHNGFYFSQEILESPNIDHHVKKSLKPLTSRKTIDKHKDITNPYLSRGAPMVTTFVRSAGNRTKELWRYIEEASRTDITLVEMEHSSLNVMSSKCTGRVPIYVHPSFYRSLKLRYPLDVDGISRDGRVTTELGIGILTPEDFRPLVDSE